MQGEPKQYQSRRFGRACRRLGVTQSMGRVGSCFANAVSEAFNSVLKAEYVRRRTFTIRTEARLKIATWITGFYNTRRLHSVCGYRARSTTNKTIRPTPHGVGRLKDLHGARGLRSLRS
jgi:transposase InsO family protein